MVTSDTISLLRETFAPLEHRSLLDIGCGVGALCKTLHDQNARMTGVDPSEEALAQARKYCPEVRFLPERAEALPFPDHAFDGAMFLNSLHHAEDIGKALSEAARIVRPGMPVVVVEPCSYGSFFEALRHLEDETHVRDAAQAAITSAVESGIFRCLKLYEYDRQDSFVDFETFLKRVISVDSRRRTLVTGNRHLIEQAFLNAATVTADNRYCLSQPLRAHVLVPD
jgi:ubiquinone/menaquinone biosynthesis C-methylase UbiE